MDDSPPAPKRQRPQRGVSGPSRDQTERVQAERTHTANPSEGEDPVANQMAHDSLLYEEDQEVDTEMRDHSHGSHESHDQVEGIQDGEIHLSPSLPPLESRPEDPNNAGSIEDAALWGGLSEAEIRRQISMLNALERSRNQTQEQMAAAAPQSIPTPPVAFGTSQDVPAVGVVPPHHRYSAFEGFTEQREATSEHQPHLIDNPMLQGGAPRIIRPPPGLVRRAHSSSAPQLPIPRVPRTATEMLAALRARNPGLTSESGTGFAPQLPPLGPTPTASDMLAALRASEQRFALESGIDSTSRSQDELPQDRQTSDDLAAYASGRQHALNDPLTTDPATRSNRHSGKGKAVDKDQLGREVPTVEAIRRKINTLGNNATLHKRSLNYDGTFRYSKAKGCCEAIIPPAYWMNNPNTQALSTTDPYFTKFPSDPRDIGAYRNRLTRDGPIRPQPKTPEFYPDGAIVTANGKTTFEDYLKAVEKGSNWKERRHFNLGAGFHIPYMSPGDFHRGMTSIYSDDDDEQDAMLALEAATMDARRKRKGQGGQGTSKEINKIKVTTNSTVVEVSEIYESSSTGSPSMELAGTSSSAAATTNSANGNADLPEGEQVPSADTLGANVILEPDDVDVGSQSNTGESSRTLRRKKGKRTGKGK
ncbi:hypothetical protein ABW19_dt0206202 [Dactylella cylindrospora]|nr:hypothetical protein ABW19_dt0206202 [Dactylella cylindrospora]